MVIRYGVNSGINFCTSDDGIFVPRNDEVNSVSRPVGGVLNVDVLFKIKTIKNVFKINGIRTIHFIEVNFEIMIYTHGKYTSGREDTSPVLPNKWLLFSACFNGMVADLPIIPVDIYGLTLASW